MNLSELDPPNGYTLTGQGQGGAAGFARMSARVSLRDEGLETLLTYAAQAEIGGKLASVGSRLLQTVAEKERGRFLLGLRPPARRHRSAGGSVAVPAARGACRQPLDGFRPLFPWVAGLGRAGAGVAGCVRERAWASHWAIASPSSHADG